MFLDVFQVQLCVILCGINAQINLKIDDKDEIFLLLN